MTKTPIAIVGCGNIASQYASTFSASDVVDMKGVFDLDPERTRAFGEEFGVTAYSSFDDLLADDVELVVNLTIHHAHFDVTTRLLEAGMHVYSEKPLALSYREARELVDLAEDRDLFLGCSPFTWLGAAQMRALEQIRAGLLGDVRVVYADVNHGRIETWHPNPAPFYGVGSMWDVGVYPLALAAAFFGPITSVRAIGRLILPTRTTLTGEPYSFTTPDLIVAMLDLANGTVVRLTTSFYVSSDTQIEGIEFHGDAGSLRLDSLYDPNANLEYAAFGHAYDEFIDVEGSQPDMAWGFGVEDMARRLQRGEPPRTSGALAAHVVDVMEAIEHSMSDDAPVAVTSTFPDPME